MLYVKQIELKKGKKELWCVEGKIKSALQIQFIKMDILSKARHSSCAKCVIETWANPEGFWKLGSL
jgi:hypothetical protein